MFPTLPTLSKQLLSTPFKRSQTGLFHGALIQFGNNVPFSKHKTRRTWLPNIQQKGLRSDLLGREFNLKVTARALRTIKKYGGLDQYILNTPSTLLGPEGMRIRIMLRGKMEEVEQRKERQRQASREGIALRRAALEKAKLEAEKGKVETKQAEETAKATKAQLPSQTKTKTQPQFEVKTKADSKADSKADFKSGSKDESSMLAQAQVHVKSQTQLVAKVKATSQPQSKTVKEINTPPTSKS